MIIAASEGDIVIKCMFQTLVGKWRWRVSANTGSDQYFGQAFEERFDVQCEHLRFRFGY